MARLIIIAGPSGAGKTFVLTQLCNYKTEITPIKKAPTRPPRENEPADESIDLLFNCTTERVKECTYTY